MFYSNTKTLYAVYDLAVSPITFDVLNFTTMAEIFRSALKLDYVHFVVHINDKFLVSYFVLFFL